MGNGDSNLKQVLKGLLQTPESTVPCGVWHENPKPTGTQLAFEETNQMEINSQESIETHTLRIIIVISEAMK